MLAPLALPVAHGSDETRDAWIRGIFTGNSPRISTTADQEPWGEAIEVVARVPGSFILVGGGNSMKPLYPSGTILVLSRVPYASLQPGQTVVYRNQRHKTVAHVLIAKARDGWRVRGLNNRTHDMEPVVSTNLLGVVVAAFSPQKITTVAARSSGFGWTAFLDDRR